MPTAINAPFPLFADRLGSPLDSGFIYIGTAGANPEVSPITVYWDQALTQPAAQPLRTAYGQVSRDGRPAPVYTSALDYSITVLDKSRRLVAYQASSVAANNGLSLAALRDDLASAAAGKGDALIATKQAGAGAVSRLLHDRTTDLQLLTDYGSIVANGTDQTANITAWFAAIGSSAAGLYVVPYNCLFNVATVVAALPPSVCLLDLSGVNDFTAAGQTTKRFGLLTSDTAPNDSQWSVDSGHHSVLMTNNFHTAATTSSTKRLASWLWAGGHYALGGLTNRGYRSCAIQQFGMDGSANFWTWGIRSLAPGTAIAADYESWAGGQVISGAGVYRLGSAAQHYVSANGGTTAAPGPTHMTGTVADGGGVQWTWIDSADRSIINIDQYGRVLLGSGPTGNTFLHKVDVTDPAGDYSMKLAATGVSKEALLILAPTNGSGVESLVPYLRASVSGGLRFMKSDSTTSLGSVTDQGWGLDLIATQSAAPTIASASSISPTKRIVFVSGTAAIATIVAPVPIAATGGQITLIPAGVFTTTAAGNIALASTAVVGKALVMTYDNATAKWYPSY